MEIDAVLIIGVGVCEVVGEAEHGGELPAALRVEVRVPTAAVHGPVTRPDVGEAARLIENERSIR